MKTIKLMFLGFWPSFNVEDNFIINILRKKYHIIISDNPDYLIFTRYDTEVYKYSCVRIFFNVENFAPDFNLCDYSIGFDEIVFLDRHCRYPLYLIADYTYYEGDNYALDYTRMEEKTGFSENDLKHKTEFCGMVVSRAQCEERDAFFDKLSQYKLVKSGGAWKNNIGYRVTDKNEFLRKCKFSIAFENSSTPGYCTEKIMQAFAASTIPIYFGDPHVGQQFNTNAFINVHDFDSFEAVIERIKQIDQDDELYMKMLSEPALLDGYASIKKEELESFLYHIVDQDASKAIRRHGQVIAAYENRYKFSVQVWKVKEMISQIKNYTLSFFTNK